MIRPNHLRIILSFDIFVLLTHFEIMFLFVLGNPESHKLLKPFITRFKNWGSPPFDWPCHGQKVRSICIFGMGDLPLLAVRPELFANKFYIDYEPFTLECMEQLIFNRTRDEYLQRMSFDTSFYRSLDIIHNKV